MLPWKILKVESKICAIWGILDANSKKSSILKFIMNISFPPSTCIHRSIILIFIEKKSMLVDFSPHRKKKKKSASFDFHFCENLHYFATNSRLCHVHVLTSLLCALITTNRLTKVWSSAASSCCFRSGTDYAALIIIIIIAFKGASRDFSQSPHSAANCLQHVCSSGPGAAVCKSRATHWALIACKCHVTCHLVRRDSSAIKFDRVEIAIIWALFYWLNH